MIFTNSTIAAIATPPGLGAIAIIKLSGSKSLSILNALSHRQHFTPRMATLVSLYDVAGDLLDQCLALYFKAPHSYTGEDVVELQCHGGIMVARLILEACLKQGAILAKGGEFTRRALLNKRMDLSQVQALAKLLESQNANMVKAMAKQIKGALKDFVQTTRTALLKLLASSEVLIDYAEEDLPLNLLDRMQEDLKQIEQQLLKVLEVSRARGTKLEGYTLSIIGKPNVGKSSLLNALLLEERALVSEIAGTTRDSIEEVISLYGSSLKIIDTAGIHTSNDPIECLGIARSKQRMQESDIILALFDLSSPLDHQDQFILELLQTHQDKILCVIFNKNDCPIKLDTKALLAAMPPLFTPAISLNTKEPCLPFLKEALKPLFEHNPNDSLILATLTQQNSLELSIKSLQSAKKPLEHAELELFSYHIKDALESIAAISTPYYTDEMLDAMFQEFCLGK
ncbi:tRNA uridine-5-carboxymethylaminomethyl(34) synthesis GTPase MnmE [Helicobacter suis]|uniref:tRNA uridine-5-carboxymethylaminomethyl(34) synthesis GTPase MnmE n=1 Tax=Helicobacter suis TaxID=104628 RepID=UPI0013D0BC22|nr:tRNA uridine-5-carboxymethylaminomethyl(34) synthesis GTPase MnmE [Helicobacter suis]